MRATEQTLAIQAIDSAIDRATKHLTRDEYIDALEELATIIEARLEAARSDGG